MKLYFKVFNFQQACKFALKKVSNVLQSEKIEALTEKYLVEDKKLKYLEFLTQMCDIIVSLTKFCPS